MFRSRSPNPDNAAQMKFAASLFLLSIFDDRPFRYTFAFGQRRATDTSAGMKL
jgi:hypothetical protein